MSDKHTYNGKLVHGHILHLFEKYPYDAMVFIAECVDGAYLSSRGDGITTYFEKWWRWCNEFAEYVLDENEELATQLGMFRPVTCDECYVQTDRPDESIDHDSDCTKAA